MGKHVYLKAEPVSIRGLCVRCGSNPQKQRSPGKFKAICGPCDRELHPRSERKNWHRGKKWAYTKAKGNSCIKCGFVAVHACQLDVDHADGDHTNSAPENLQTLCANCHRLKTFMQRWKSSHNA